MVTVNCEHVLQGETTLMISVTAIDDVIDNDDDFFDGGDVDDGN